MDRSQGSYGLQLRTWEQKVGMLHLQNLTPTSLNPSKPANVKELIQIQKHFHEFLLNTFAHSVMQNLSRYIKFE